MKTTEQTRRELFEVSMREALLTEGYDPISIPCVMGVGSDGQYSSVRIRGAWQGFNAAMDAVVIELPGANDAMKAVFDYHHGPSNKNVTGTTNWAANVGMTVVNDCRAAIESTGLGLKVK